MFSCPPVHASFWSENKPLQFAGRVFYRPDAVDTRPVMSAYAAWHQMVPICLER